MNDSLTQQTHAIVSRLFKNNPESKYKIISSYTKVYPDFVRIIKYKRPIVVDRFHEITSSTLPNEEEDLEFDYLQKSINRTKTKIADLVLANRFTHFATFTFDAKNKKVGGEENRHDFKKMSLLIQKWLNNEQKNHLFKFRHKFKYLIVPERHKNGAWHFHALFQDYKNASANFYSSKNPYITVKELKKAKRYPNRQYLPRYTLGRSEIAPIRDKTKMANYIKKYITKELITEPHAKRYWASRNLNRPEIIENLVSEFTKIPQEFKKQEHEYHEIFEIPRNSEYFAFLFFVKRIENAERVEKNKWRWANSYKPVD